MYLWLTFGQDCHSGQDLRQCQKLVRPCAAGWQSICLGRADWSSARRRYAPSRARRLRKSSRQHTVIWYYTHRNTRTAPVAKAGHFGFILALMRGVGAVGKCITDCHMFMANLGRSELHASTVRLADSLTLISTTLRTTPHRSLGGLVVIVVQSPLTVFIIFPKPP